MKAETLVEATVLLVEDDPNDVLLTRLAFQRARLANPLQVVRDGEEALSYLGGEGRYADRDQFPFPILLLLDLHMPRMDGFQVLEWLKGQRRMRRLPVAILTQSDQDPYVERAYQLGADSYLLKPPDTRELLTLIQRLHATWMIIKEEADTVMV